MLQELCYVKGLKFVACHHFNREPFIVEINQKDEGAVFGVCKVCNTRYELIKPEPIVR
jgi:hypothetical protein